VILFDIVVTFYELLGRNQSKDLDSDRFSSVFALVGPTPAGR
jgi:hypothetical protein